MVFENGGIELKGFMVAAADEGWADWSRLKRVEKQSESFDARM